MSSHAVFVSFGYRRLSSDIGCYDIVGYFPDIGGHRISPDIVRMSSGYRRIFLGNPPDIVMYQLKIDGYCVDFVGCLSGSSGITRISAVESNIVGYRFL